MAKKIAPGSPPEIPEPSHHPEIEPDYEPEEPVIPGEEPDIIPEEEPFKTPPYEIPPPGEGP